MIKSYIKIALRNLIRGKAYSIINIGGLAIGLSCSIAIGLYIWDEYSFDRFHTNYKNIYRVVEQQNQAGTIYDIAVTPGPLAPALKIDFAEVQQTCRIGMGLQAEILQVGEKTFEPEEVLVVDNSFFSLFNFRLIQGNMQKALLGSDEIVITETMAARIFGPEWQHSDSLLGQQIQISDGRVLTLSGVAQNPPTNSHIQFDVLLSCHFDELKSSEAFYNWDSNNYHTYVCLNPDANAVTLSKKLAKLLNKYSNDTSTILKLQPLSDIYLYSDFDFQTDWSKTSNIVYIQIFIAVGVIVLMIALFNFINLSTARAVNRAKEVGVRKVSGAFHKQLITQFLNEALIMVSLAVCIALFILQFVLLLLNDITGKSLVIPFTEQWFQLALVGFTLLVSILAGTYPAFYLSGFKPAKVLKGSLAIQSGQIFRKILVVVQFTFSVLLINATIVIYKQLVFLKNKDLGFDQSQLVYVTMKNKLGSKALLLKADLENETSIDRVACSSSDLVNVNNSTGNISWEGKGPNDKILITHMNITPDFLATTGMKLSAGRNFDPAFSTDTSSAYLINETAAKRMGWSPDQAVGKTIRFSNIEGKIIGVVKDFHFRPMTVSIDPLLFRYWPREQYSGLFVKVIQVPDGMSAIKKVYKKYDSQTSPNYQFVNQELENQYRAQQTTSRIVLYFSILAIVLSCLGLYGLATYTAEQRTKEIGVRKVLGASITSILNLLSKDFLKLVVIAIVIASTFAWWGMSQWLNGFAYKVRIDSWIFIFSGLAAISISLLTVSYQSIKVALMNPVNNLRSE